MINDKVATWLGLDKSSNPEKRISIINQNLKKINELSKALNSVIDKNESEIFSSWKEKVKEKYPKLELVEANILQTEIPSPITQKPLVVLIWRGKRDGIIKFVCEVDTKDHKAFDESDANLLREKLTIIDDQRYQYAAFYDVDPGENQYDVAFKMFCNILDLLLNTKKE